MTFSRGWLAGFLAVYFVAAIVQYTLYINCDVSWDFYITQSVLSGGQYIKDFFDVSPPSTFYLYLIPSFFAKFFAVNVVVALRSYVFALVTLTIFLCVRLLRPPFSIEQNSARFFLVLLAAVLLILPFGEFGQRDHLFIVLIIPYLVLMAARLQGLCVNQWLAGVIGLLGAAGFAVKPFFLAPLVLVELFYMIQQRRFFAVLRTESIIIFLMMVVYLGVTFYFYQNYFTMIVPLLTEFYYINVRTPLFTVLLNPLIFFTVAGAYLFFLLKFRPSEQPLLSILIVALAGAVIAYAMQQTLWYYHFIPVFSLTILIYGLFCSYLYQQHLCERENLIIGFFSGITLAFWMLTIVEFAMYGLALIAIFLVLFGIFVFRNKVNAVPHLIKQGFIVSVGGFILWVFAQIYQGDHYRDRQSDLLISFMQTHAKNEPIQYFSTDLSTFFPAIYYAGAIPASRFAHLVFMASLLVPTQQNQTARQLYFDMVVEDFIKFKPKFVFVNQDDYGTGRDKTKIQVDYITFFSQDPRFRTIWQSYSYLTNLKSTPLPGAYGRNIDVYKRNDYVLHRSYTSN